MKKWICIGSFILINIIIFALPSLESGSFGYNRDNTLNFSRHVYITMEALNFNETEYANGKISDILKNQTNEIQLGTNITKFSESSEQLELDSYADNINNDGNMWGHEYAIFGQITQEFKNAVKNYNDAMQAIQQYPDKQIEKWKLPPQLNIEADTHSRRLQMQFAEPMYLGL
ncbi:MAG: hypothetical protein NTX05_06335 [Fusobacteria bacterium]|nr:hypothetical protein [Fusobacteriota bacterium]